MLLVQDKDVEGGHCLVTSGLDRGVHMWDTERGRYMQSKTGNRAAINSLAFDPTDNLLLGAGVEEEIVVWDLWGNLGAPLFRLQGHRSSILRQAILVVSAPGKGRAASLDEKGKVVLWDTRRNAAVDTNERCLCQVESEAERPTWVEMITAEGEDLKRWSHVGVTVVTTGKRLRLYDDIDPRVAEPALSHALYSPQSVSFVTCNGDLVTLWDACTGKAIRSESACQGEIVCAALDSGERKLLLATSLGELLVYNFLQGVRVGSFTPGHRGPVSCLGYVAEDKASILVTGGWDRSLRVYDEVPREGDPPLLRQVDAAHTSDINALAVSHMFSLVATGSAGGSIRLWDLQFLSGEGICRVGDEASAMLFLEPYPLLLVGDAGGRVSLIPVRLWLGQGHRNEVVASFLNDTDAPETVEGPSAVTSLAVRRSSFHRSRTSLNPQGTPRWVGQR
ncbi:unnamed protein product [Discosporangium mesarthrocarpum]